MIRWGVIGAGGFADRRVIPQINEAEGCMLEAVMVRDLKRAKALAEKHGARKFYDSMDAFLSDREIDAVYLCTPVHLHKEQTIKVAEAGKHILCEKPMALNTEECNEMIGVCKRYGVKLMIGFMMRFHPGHKRLQEIINEGPLGEVVLAHIQHFQWYPPTEGAWRQNPELGGGGVLMDTGSHCIDLLCFLLGRVRSVRGKAGNIVFDYPVEDTATIILDFEGGPYGVIENSFAVPYRENHLEIHGTEGVVLMSKSIGPFKEFQMKMVNEKGEKLIDLIYEDPYRREFEEFASSITDGKEPPVTGEDGKENLRIIEAAYRSSQSGGREEKI